MSQSVPKTAQSQTGFDAGGALYLGLDLGGTKIAAALVTRTGAITARTEIPTPAKEEPEAVVEALAAAALEVCRAAGRDLGTLAGVGVGAPGPVDHTTGTLVEPPNLPRFRRVPLGAMLGARLGLHPGPRLVLDNDTNLGETHPGPRLVLDNDAKDHNATNATDTSGLAETHPAPRLVLDNDANSTNASSTSGLAETHPAPRLVLDNDANAAGLAEARFGAGRGASSLIYLTISTGIGGALLFDGALWRGAAGAAGELGHLVIQPGGPRCGCGGQGCLEALASGTAIAREARLALHRGAKSILADHPHPEAISARDVAEAAEGGDALALELLSTAFGFLGLGVASLVNVMNPARVVLGGGLAALGDRLLGPVREGIRTHANPLAAGSVEVVLAALGRDAGVVGAAALAMP